MTLSAKERKAVFTAAAAKLAAAAHTSPASTSPLPPWDDSEGTEDNGGRPTIRMIFCSPLPLLIIVRQVSDDVVLRVVRSRPAPVANCRFTRVDVNGGLRIVPCSGRLVS